MGDIKYIIEEPLKELISELRNVGFNTICSCGHLPSPYIQMEWYSDDEITKLYNFLIENNYKDFVIKAFWDSKINSRHLEIEFSYIKKQLATIKQIKI